MHPLIIVLVIVVVIMVMIVAHVQAQQRREALFKLATELGFQFDADPGDVHSRFVGFSPFGVGSSRRSSNLLSGTWKALEWTIFEYRYVTGSGKNRTTHHCGVVAAELPVSIPELTLRPEGIFDKIASMAGFDDINFESEAFSRMYHVKCDDRKLAYDLIHPLAIELMLSLPRMHWQFRGRRVLIYAPGNLSREQIVQRMDAIERFSALIPEYLRQERRAR